MVVKTIKRPSNSEFFLLGRGKRRLAAFDALHPHAVSTAAEVRRSVAHAGRDSLWVSYDYDLTQELVRSVSAASTSLGLGRGLFIHALDARAIPALSTVFRRIAFTADGEYRRVISKKRLQEERSFGASLRRLRKQRGLRRGDFEPDISEKTIARIEQGKVQRVRQKMLAALAKRLKVEPQEISSF